MRPIPLALALALSTLSFGCLSAMTPKPASYVGDSTGLVLPQWTLYQGSTGSLSYQTAVAADGTRFIAAPRVHGKACQRGLSIPILSALAMSGPTMFSRSPGSLSAGWGDGGYQAAVDDAKKNLPKEAILYDVRADLQYRMVLTIYHEQCVHVDAGLLLPLVSKEQPAMEP